MAEANHITSALAEYRDIEGFLGCQIGDNGVFRTRFATRHRKELPLGEWRYPDTKPNKNGYIVANLYRDGRRCKRYVHHLVLEAFVGPCPPGLECCHGPGGPSDNRLENLEWGTHEKNQADRIRDGTSNQGSRQGNSKLIEEFIPIIRKMSEMGFFQSQIAEVFGVHQTDISCILLGKSWTHVA